MRNKSTYNDYEFTKQRILNNLARVSITAGMADLQFVSFGFSYIAT